ncbi:hypothetical protein LTR61_012090, partial [Exophiala xenobiotica]
ITKSFETLKEKDKCDALDKINRYPKILNELQAILQDKETSGNCKYKIKELISYAKENGSATVKEWIKRNPDMETII